jgi:hypothetical protein
MTGATGVTSVTGVTGPTGRSNGSSPAVSALVVARTEAVPAGRGDGPVRPVGRRI